MRLLVNGAVTALFSFGLLAVITDLHHRVSRDHRNFTREFLLGIVAAVAVVLFRAVAAELPVSRAILSAGLLTTGVLVAVTEEAGKLAGLGVSRLRLPPAGGHENIFAGMALGLGFALFENSWYLPDATLVLVFRGVTAVPLHATTAGLLGWGLASTNRPNRLGLAFLAAVALHGGYNAMIDQGGILVPATVFLVGAAATVLAMVISTQE